MIQVLLSATWSHSKQIQIYRAIDRTPGENSCYGNYMLVKMLLGQWAS